MKIGDSKPLKGPTRAQPVAKTAGVSGLAAGAPGAARQVGDVTSIMDIPEAEFTPKVRAAIMTLMAEVEKLRKELQQSQARIAFLERLADQDTLTPVANRRAFVRELSRMMSFAERYDTVSSVIYFDVNGLKAINDAHGHAAGDAVLAHVARVLTQSVRDSDFVGRLGGDEFGVILAYTDEPTANEKAASLSHAIGSEAVEWQGVKIPVSVSYGTYTFRGGEDPSGALDAADRAMYARKRKSATGA